MKRFLVLGVLLLQGGCDDGPARYTARDAGVDTTQVAGVCELSKCPKPRTGTACCTPDAQCGSDSTGLGLTCDANSDDVSTRKCILKDCPTPLLGAACCTPRAQCGWDPFASGLLCLANAQLNLPKDAGPPPPPLCNLASCPITDGGPAACCQLNGQCGVDTLGIGLCFPPPTCNLNHCPTAEGGPKACCQANGACGIDILGVGLCFPPPTPLCNLATCPMPDGGLKPCCLPNGQCGVDTFGIGLCFAPQTPTCNLAKCPTPAGGIRACCLPNAACGQDTFGIGLCFAPPPAMVDAGPPAVSTPPDDPSITGECPSYLGLAGPVWGCCSKYGVCGTFASNQCLLALGTQLPVGPPPPPEAGVSEPFLRCTPPQSEAPR